MGSPVKFCRNTKRSESVSLRQASTPKGASSGRARLQSRADMRVLRKSE